MKLLVKIALFGLLFTSCKSLQTTTQTSTTNLININLVDIKNDKVQVDFTLNAPKKDTLIYYMPKTVPGTYSSDNYGQFLEDFKAFDNNGNLLPTEQLDQNSWRITKASKLKHLSYLVNDSFDSEYKINEDDRLFSPAGTNILAENNFVLNLHGFVGYFKEFQNKPYSITINHPKDIIAATSTETKPIAHKNTSEKTTDTYNYNRYANVTDEPIIYGKLDNVTFKINDIEVLLSVYSPNNIHSAASILPSMEKMMTAQKHFMGNINSTKKYSILLYLSTLTQNDAHGFGALEHNNSTVVVLPETMSLERLEKSMIDVVSHEFFHIITPLTVHSEEIHNFDYYEPKMSEHLWMYEGTTEYFAQLFQVYEGLISEKEFLTRINTKIKNSYEFDDRMSFTEMSKNILSEPYKANYINVYEKGALISMCIDIIIREQSNGEKGILNLMKELSTKYGANKAFKDNELIDTVISLTYPEVGEFLNKHVIGTTPINYQEYLKKVGLVYGDETTETDYLVNNDIPYLSAKRDENKIYFNNSSKYNTFLESLKIMPNDVLLAINNKKFDLNNAHYLFKLSKEWKVGNTINMIIERGGVELLTNTVIKKTPTVTSKSILNFKQSLITNKQQLTKKAWLNK